MTKILVTGASGDIGRKTVLHLLKKIPANQVVGFVRDPAKAKDLADLGVELRQGDYLEPETLKRAFKGIDKVMLTSAHAFTDRKTAQGNVIDAAVEAGVKHILYMAILRSTDFNMPDITPDDLFTEEKLKSSGLDYTIAYHPPFIDVLSFYIGMKPQETGVQVPAGNGKFAPASRDDLAAAHAAILTGKGHENKSYRLYGDPGVSFSDMADILSKITGKKVPYIVVSDAEFLELRKAEFGVPDYLAAFALKWVQGMNAGEWEPKTKDLEKLLGRRPTTTFEFMRAQFSKPAP